MKRFSYIAILAGLMLTTKAFADDVVTVPTEQFIGAAFQFLGGLAGLKGMALVLAVVQLAMLFFRSPLASFAGKHRLLIVLSLTLLTSVVTLVSQGLPLMAALMHGTSLSALQVLGHQLWKQFVEKSDEAPPAA